VWTCGGGVVLGGELENDIAKRQTIFLSIVNRSPNNTCELRQRLLTKRPEINGTGSSLEGDD